MRGATRSSTSPALTSCAACTTPTSRSGVDCVETNTFGANYANLGEYDISDRIYELAHAGAQIAAESAQAWSTAEQPRFVIGSVGPGTKLPSLGHAPFALLRDAYAEQTRGMIDGGVDAILIETSQDLLQAKAAVIGARRALADAGETLPVMVQVTVETTGTMLMGSEIGAALTALEPLGIDVDRSQLCYRPDRDERAPSPPLAARPDRCHLHAQRRPTHAHQGGRGLPPDRRASWLALSSSSPSSASLVGGCCGTTPDAPRGREGGRGPGAQPPNPARPTARVPRRRASRSARSVRPVHRRAHQRRRPKAFPDAMLAGVGTSASRSPHQTRDGARLLDVSVDYVGRDGPRT